MSLQSDAANAKVMTAEMVNDLDQRSCSLSPYAAHKLCLSHERLRAERDELKMLIQACQHLIMASHGPKDGPTSYEETKQRIIEECRKWIK